MLGLRFKILRGIISFFVRIFYVSGVRLLRRFRFMLDVEDERDDVKDEMSFKDVSFW